MQGDLLLPEPVGRLIRRAEVTRENGMTILSNVYENDEFMRTKDVNFRPVWTATSPDGAMMMIDMHRGIIQQGNWTRPGSYLRGIIDKWGLAENIRKGRIYRLEHTTFEPDKKPRMLEESTAELVAHLSHPNGWWRDTAQKLIILREDGDTVVPALQELVRTGSTELGRLHAFWTLEGLDKMTPEVVQTALRDSSSLVRTSAIRVAEPYLASRDQDVIKALLENSELQNDIEMQLQSLNSIVYSGTTDPALLAYSKQLISSQSKHPAFQGVVEQHEAVKEARAAAIAMQAKSEDFAKSMEQGKIAFEQLCYACHGADGHGEPMPGTDGGLLAPSFAGNKRLMKTDHLAVRTLLHGLTGDLDGKEYAGLMVGMGNNSDEWIADVVTYIRNSFGNEAPQTDPKTVAALRALDIDRTEPWTQSELENYTLPVLDRKDWKLTASNNEAGLRKAVDGDDKSRYSTEAYQKKGMWVQVELPKPTQVQGLLLDYARSAKDGPDKYAVSLSMDGKNWSKPVASGKAGEKDLNLLFPPVEARFVRIEITETKKKKLYWSIHELDIYGK